MGSSTKRAWKLQEFVAHAGTVNCLALGHKSGRVIVTGGEDKKVNMWAVGKPNCIMSLSGHTSPVEAVRFGNAEEMVVAGSLSGALKIWDLEAAKIVRTLTGHKSAIKSLDFHPYGDFVASGSADTNIKLWDVRRKGCIFTYKGHTNTVGCLRFSPDGRWIASAGDDGLLKMWDLTAGKLLNDFTHHKAAVTTVEFHPNEFLLASGSADRTVKFWDLETFQLVSTTDGESTPIRNIFFHPEGSCLYSAAQDQLKVYGWEPAQCYDSLSIGWGKVTDIAMAQNQLIGATFSQSNVSTYVVDISRVSPLGGTPVQPVSPVSPPMTASGRRSYISNDRPPTASTKQAPAPAEEADESAGKDDDIEDTSEGADIQNPQDYRDIFQANNKLARSPPKNMEPFPAPLDDNVPSPVVVKAAPPPSQPVTSRVSQPPPPKQAESAPPKSSKPPSSRGAAPSKSSASPQPRSSPPERDKPKSKAQPPPADNGLNPEDFLPRQAVPNIMSEGGVQKNMSESEALSLMAKGHGSMIAVMHNRQKNLQIVRALWTSGNVKTACDSAIGMNDKAVIIDILNVLNQKSGLWNLDLCASLIPQLSDLIISKYENYTNAACSALRIVLKNFGPVIKSNLQGGPSIGVDISREERHNKCKLCYKELMHIRSLLQDKSKTRGAGNFREIQLLLSQLD